MISDEMKSWVDSFSKVLATREWVRSFHHLVMLDPLDYGDDWRDLIADTIKSANARSSLLRYAARDVKDHAVVSATVDAKADPHGYTAAVTAVRRGPYGVACAEAEYARTLHDWLRSIK